MWLGLWNRLAKSLGLSPRSLGEKGERAAARYLEERGFTIVARGLRDRLSEIDLIAVEGRTVVFVEVKTRASADHGRPEEAVDRDKQQRLTRAALAYLKKKNLLQNATRFDVIGIVWPDEKSPPAITHIRNAFQASGRDSFYS
jgi:putative endonuclease